MAIIGKVYETEVENGLTIKNIPYSKHDSPCFEGCCENELTINASDAHKVAWLFEEYMPLNEIKEFNFNDWTDDLEKKWEEYLCKKDKEN
jgi:hypothetical protein